METKNTFLKVMSILCLIGGIIAIIVAIAAMALGAGSAVILASAGADPSYAQYSGLLIIAGVLALVAGIVEIIAAKAGFNALKDPSKANKCVTIGIILIVLSLISSIMTAVGGGSFVSNIFVGIIFPILYILAAKKGWSA